MSGKRITITHLSGGVAGHIVDCSNCGHAEVFDVAQRDEAIRAYRSHWCDASNDLLEGEDA